MSEFKNNPFAPVENVEGYTTLDGHQIIEIRTRDQRAFVPAVEFAEGGGAAMRTLKHFNIVPQPEVRADIMRRVAQIEAFPEGLFLGRPGSTAPYFALSNGTVFAPDSVALAEAVYPRLTKQLGSAGTLESYKKKVLKPLIGNPIPSFMAMLPFAVPLAELAEGVGNVGFELVGPPAQGKTTALMIAASIIGSAVDRETSYLVSMNATANGLESILTHFRDMLVVFEEGQLFSAGDTPSIRATKWREFCHRLADGTSKLRGQYGTDARPEVPVATRFWFVLSSNEPIAEVLGGGNTDQDRAVLQRLQSIPGIRKFGVYDRLPKGTIGGSALSDQLAAVMQHNHGVAMRGVSDQARTGYA